MATFTISIDDTHPGLLLAVARSNAARLLDDPAAVPETAAAYAQRVLVDAVLTSFVAAYINLLEAVGNAQWRANMADGQDPVTAKANIATPTEPATLLAEAQKQGVL